MSLDSTLQRPSIQILPDHVTRKIAAGEVIERPASIVKELMENSIDAFANHIDVSITNGGMSSIMIQDNGVGIAPTELSLAVAKNATSKIVSDEDLLQLQTYGFRGEALSSISAVSKFELHTKRKQDSEGSVIRVAGGEVQEIAPTGTTDGTRIQIANLFYNTPARKKFLRSKSTEFAHIEKTFKKMVLPHSEIHFTLRKDEENIYALPIVETYLQRIEQLYPKKTTEKLVSFEAKHNQISMFGWISNSYETSSTPQEIWTFINRRWISDRMIQKGIMEGYRTALMEHRYPMCFIFIELSPHLYDVNVHPSKSEVRFEKPQEIYQLLVSTIAHALKKSPAIHRVHPSTHLFGQSQSIPFSNVFSRSAPYPTQSSSWIRSARENTEKYNPPTTGFFSNLECLGTLDHTYILCRDSQSLIIVDQHAAHERVLFEELKKNVSKSSPAQQTLLLPLTLNLSTSQSESIRDSLLLLQSMGFDLENFGDTTWLVRSVPSLLKEKNAQRVLMDFAEDNVRETSSTDFQDYQNHRLSTIACHAAVRAHDALNMDEVQHLLRRMDEVILSSYCPHGRPTFLHISTEQLEKLFQRT